MDSYLEEYSSDDAIRKYTSRTAGHGISFLLEHDYADVYLNALGRYLNKAKDTPLRLLEFGCGGGMNIINLVARLEREGRRVEVAYGTDFSERLIEAARNESRMLLPSALQGKMHFSVARNEQLATDLAGFMQCPRSDLSNFFDVILGVNTSRYAYRLGKAKEAAQDVSDLLKPGGVCIVIDMNQRFPAFRSKWRSSSRTVPAIEKYLPSLDEYAAPFEQVGLEVLRKENFCWVPHSASRKMTAVYRFLTPLLNLVAKPWAMRSLVIARKRA